MIVLHTADWHLGVRSGPVSRTPDHDLFLDWLLDTIEEESVDTLVIAGDVFDSHQPSAEALERYYGFLARCPGSGLRHVVVVGGNHDSASRLQAPAPLLRALNVHVVGGLTQETRDRGDHIVPLRAQDGEVEAVVLAVPYVQEFRLGIRPSAEPRSELHASFTTAFRALYTELTDRAEAEFPGVPILATGHLTVGDDHAREDYPHEIHQVGAIEAMPASIFDPRIRYVALGHIHRSYPVDDTGRAWYSGTPISTSLPEGRSPRRLLALELGGEGGPIIPRRLEVPSFRSLHELRGPLDEIVAAIRDLDGSEPLPPLLYVRVIEDDLPGDFQARLQEAVEAYPESERPVIAESRHERATPLSDEEVEETGTLDEMEPEEVFRALARTRSVEVDDGLRSAFRQVLECRAEDFDALVAELTEGGE